MTQTTARIKQAGKNFEIVVDLDDALKFRKGLSNSVNFLDVETVFTDSKKGLKASEKDVMSAFGTTDISAVASKIVKSGEVLLTQEHRDDERDKRIKQVIDFIRVNAIDPKTGNPYTPEIITSPGITIFLSIFVYFSFISSVSALPCVIEFNLS